MAAENLAGETQELEDLKHLDRSMRIGADADLNISVWDFHTQ